MRNKLLLLGVLALLSVVLAANVWADKLTESTEKYWNPNPQEVYVDVPEVEPNGTIATATPLGCGNVLRPAAISPAGDNDYVSFSIGTVGTVISFGTDADGATPAGDTYIHLYNPSGTQVATDDDSGPGAYSLITYTTVTTGTFYGRIRHYSSTGTGTYKAFVNCAVPEPPPPNDQCAGAIDIPCGPIQLSGSTQWATNDYNPAVPGPSCTGFTVAGKDVAYKFTINAGAVLNVTYTSSADGSFYVVTDCANTTTTCVVGADATVTGQPEVINYTFGSAGTYYLILDNYGTNAWGTWTLTGTLTCPVGVSGSTWGAVKNIYR